MSDIQELTEKTITFRDKRDWKQFHNPKDAALSLMLESAEVLEHFQWKNQKEVEEYIVINKKRIGEELADVLYWVLIMSHDIGIDIKTAFEEKLIKNGQKYPIEKSRGNSTKYDKL